MSARAKTVIAAAAQAGIGGKRRESIFMALHDCIIKKGYAATSLADVARAAGMSSSHLLYYFPGKDAILAQYFAHITRRIIDRLESFRGEPPDRQIQLLATLFFSGAGVTKSEIGFMLECFGVAVHDKELQREKSELDRFCKTYLRELFEKFTDGPSKPAEAAEIVYAMLVGLRTAAYFDERLGPQQALDIFRDQMMNMAAAGRRDRKKKLRARPDGQTPRRAGRATRV